MLAGALGHPLCCYAELDSCLDALAALAKAGAPAGCWVTADWQRAGRGRQGRRWESPPGASLLMALLLRPAGEAPAAALHSLAAAVALARAGRRLGAALAVKWPNDVLSPGGAKVAGILPEARVEGGRCRHLLLGVGVNVHQGFGPGAPPPAAGADSLDRVLGRRADRGALLAAFLAELEPWVAELDAGRHDALVAAWEAAWPHRGRLAVDEAGRRWRLEGLARDGRLRVRDAAGERLLAAGSLALLPAGDEAAGSGGEAAPGL